MTNVQPHEQLAREYLAAQFGVDLPEGLTAVAAFNEKVLEGEGAVTVFTFRAARADNPPQDFYVVAGETEPNYYPTWNLLPDEIYSLHIGTRFMLVLEIQQIRALELPPTFEKEVVDLLARVAPGEPVEDFRVLAAFALDGQCHAVCRMKIAAEDICVVGGDLPLGIYRRTDLPPQVVYRLHLGTVIRMEDDEEEQT